MTTTERYRQALEKIAKWELPSTGEFWDEEKTRPVSYEANYGSNGARDYIKKLASEALASATPNENDETKYQWYKWSKDERTNYVLHWLKSQDEFTKTSWTAEGSIFYHVSPLKFAELIERFSMSASASKDDSLQYNNLDRADTNAFYDNKGSGKLVYNEPKSAKDEPQKGLEQENKEWREECERLAGIADFWQKKYYEVCPPHQNPKIDNF